MTRHDEPAEGDVTGVAGLVAVPLLGGLLADTEDRCDPRPRVAAKSEVRHLAFDVALDVAAAGDEGLEVGGRGHTSRILDDTVDRQGTLTTGLEELESGGLDGLHHLWCKRCHPAWDASPLGVGVGNPFTAWCGARSVILVYHLSDDMPPNPCPRCADSAMPCATCGATS